ncbi:MAG: DUF2244 domain-containing protein [Candidatus Thiodiazotropha taylori]|uniref:DUF2244 domain-containing protein n=1 Tax=Candidatus Thiodiazotropha taylori TaxID=2792791 RepID=A0A9E4KCY5_9GAMM|nr:DUF2244 domain-containing protein [Candidatus Thiodiazotropha taylori]MCW4256440.1 DUF2244 domain-containing protein [Candidatus Thiodiazotropha taylori]
MILRDSQNSDSDEAVLIINPNRNLTWQQSKWLFFFFAFCCSAVAAYFYSIGAWLVLPFAGLEILLIGIAIYCQSCCAHSKQIIRIDSKHVRVINSGRVESEKCFHKSWLKIIRNRDPSGWYPSRLLIGSHGQFVEVGKDLIEEERETLAHNLKSAIEGI